MSALVTADVETLTRFLHDQGDDGIWEHFDRRNAEIVARSLVNSGVLDRLVADAVETLAEDETLMDASWSLLPAAATCSRHAINQVTQALAAALRGTR